MEIKNYTPLSENLKSMLYRGENICYTPLTLPIKVKEQSHKFHIILILIAFLICVITCYFIIFLRIF